MIVPTPYLGGDLVTGLEFQLPDLPFAQSVTSFVPQVARASTTSPLVVRIQSEPGASPASFIEATIPAGQLDGAPVSGGFSAVSLWVRVVSSGGVGPLGAGYLTGYAVTSAQSQNDHAPFQIPGLLMPATQTPFLIAPTGATVDRFSPLVINSSPAQNMILRLKTSQATLDPAQYLESIIPTGQKVGPVNAGSILVPADGRLWLDVVGGDGTAGWLYGTARVAPTALLGELFCTPLYVAGMVPSGSTWLVRSPPFLTTLRFLRASFRGGDGAFPVSITAELDGQPATTLQLDLTGASTFVGQSGTTLACAASTMLRIRVATSAPALTWLTGALYFEAPIGTAIGLIARRVTAVPRLYLSDGITIGSVQQLPQT